MKESIQNTQIAGIILLISSLACRPVVTVGWGEILLVGVIVILIVGLPLIRIFRSRQGTEKSNHGQNNKLR
jgi:hypothetical protein